MSELDDLTQACETLCVALDMRPLKLRRGAAWSGSAECGRDTDDGRGLLGWKVQEWRASAGSGAYVATGRTPEAAIRKLVRELTQAAKYRAAELRVAVEQAERVAPPSAVRP